MIVNSFKLSEKDVLLLEEFMNDNNIKNKSAAIRQCIKIAIENKNLEDFLFEQDKKMNRLLHNVFMTKKLVEQFFVNTGFAENINLSSDFCLKEFYKINDSYKKDFLG